MGRGLTALFLAEILTACAPVAAITAIPSSLIEGAIYMMRGEEASFPHGVDQVLTATQRGLVKLKLNADVVEPIDDGYGVLFGGATLDGTMHLKRETAKLTKILIKVRKRGLREGSIERAVLAAIHEQVAQVAPGERIDLAGYLPLLAAPKDGAKQLGWYRPGSFVHVEAAYKGGWLKVTLPSGRKGYLRKQAAAAVEDKEG